MAILHDVGSLRKAEETAFAKLSMDPERPLEMDDDREPLVLRQDEVVAHRWPAPGGRGVLTNHRLLLLTHPEPIHRLIRWGVNLEAIENLEVQSVAGIDPTFEVDVNRRAIYIGYPNPCADVQKWIDEARMARCMALYGQLLPFHPGPPTEEDGQDEEVQEEAVGLGQTSAPEAWTADMFLLFIAGEPFKDAVLGARNPMIFGAATGGRLVTDRFGGHEPADFRPGQIYGVKANWGRMVLDIAAKWGAKVKVVDVDHPGADEALVQRWILPDADLPLMVGPEGARLEGEESFVPARVSKFFQDRRAGRES